MVTGVDLFTANFSRNGIRVHIMADSAADLIRAIRYFELYGCDVRSIEFDAEKYLKSHCSCDSTGACSNCQ